MPISLYLKNLRSHIGRDLVLMPAVAALVRNEAGHVLFQRRTDDGLWSLPAGSVDPGETPSQALVREVQEETGLLVEPTRVVGVFGDSTAVDRWTPVSVVGLSSGLAQISAGRSHTCGVDTSGRALCWGNNASGQLGDGTTTFRYTPVGVSGLSK